MIRQIELCLLPAEAHDDELIRRRVARKCKVKETKVDAWRFLRRSIDARKKQVYIRVLIEVFIGY